LSNLDWGNMIRRILLGVAVSASLAAVPAVAGAHVATHPSVFGHGVRFVNGANRVVHVGTKPNWAPLRAAYRRYARAHHIKLHNSSFRHASARSALVTTAFKAAKTQPQPPVKLDEKGYDCAITQDQPSFPSFDSYLFSQKYAGPNGDKEISQTQSCSGNFNEIAPSRKLSSTVTSTETDCTVYGPSGEEGTLGAYADFSDGEFVDSCSTPATGLGRQILYSGVFDAGFSCEATIGTGSNDKTPLNVRNGDSVEYGLVYETPAFTEPDASFTTACVGEVPTRTVFNTKKIVVHKVACSEASPIGPIPASGLSVTFPDGQYSETCTAPTLGGLTA
jgi:hypothetical protein